MGVKYDWELVRRRQFFEDSRETVYRHALECLESARSEKKKKGVRSYGRSAWLLLTLSKPCSRCGHNFAAGARPRSLQKKMATCVTLFHSSWRRTESGAFCLNQPIHERFARFRTGHDGGRHASNGNGRSSEKRRRGGPAAFHNNKKLPHPSK